jgi:hypothetical protein
VLLLPFPAVTAPTGISQQLTYLKNLDKAKQKASRAIGLLISLGKELETDENFISDECIPIVLECFGEDVGVLRNYIILMFFIRKVSHKPNYLINLQYLKWHLMHSTLVFYSVQRQTILLKSGVSSVNYVNRATIRNYHRLEIVQFHNRLDNLISVDFCIVCYSRHCTLTLLYT